MDQDDSVFIGREPCPECGSNDNLARYSDGHAYCFGCEHYEAGDGEVDPVHERKKMSADLLDIEFTELRKRGLTKDACQKFGYGTANYKGKGVHAATYHDRDGKRLGQKLRFKEKKDGMPWVGTSKGAALFGQQIWSGTGKKIVITEGEIDAITVAQVQGLKWPAVSLINGASGAKRDLSNNLEFLSGYEEIILMFDMDEPGREAVEEAVKILPFGKAKIAQLPLKDANECLLAGRSQDIIQAIWNAKPWTPDGILSVEDIADEASQPIEWGLSWCFPKLTQATYGRRLGEIYAVGAGTGVGKTDFLLQQIDFDVTTLGETVGLIMLEQMPTETLKRLAGKNMNERFHIPDAGWTVEQLREGIEKFKGKVSFYDNFGHTDWDTVAIQIRHMATAMGHQVIYLDHLTAMADPDNERGSIEKIMVEMAGLAKELQIIITFVSHLATPEGKSHEEGGRVTIRHFKGARAIGFWSYFMFGLERDQQADDPSERSTTTFRVLKDRYTGQATGLTIKLGYDHTKGLLFEKDDEDAPAFVDETGDF